MADRPCQQRPAAWVFRRAVEGQAINDVPLNRAESYPHRLKNPFRDFLDDCHDEPPDRADIDNVFFLNDRVRDGFRGYSFEGPFDGSWIAEDSSVYEEQHHKLEVVLSKEEIDKARELFVSIGNQLGQRAIFFEVRAGGEIIELD